MTRSGREGAIYRTLNEYANQHTTDAEGERARERESVASSYGYNSFNCIGRMISDNYGIQLRELFQPHPSFHILLEAI